MYHSEIIHAPSPQLGIPIQDAPALPFPEQAQEPCAPLSHIKHKEEREEINLHSLLARGSSPERDPMCSGITREGALIPPRKENMQGPAAYHPYLRGEMISCRPGGPRLYDLLNELPLEEFGTLSWSVVDREEEIFEFTDIRDEDKVMLALWNRWIMLNRCYWVLIVRFPCVDTFFRVDFVFEGYYKGVEGFINQYFEMIHRAAGWNALRMFLLVCCLTSVFGWFA